MDVFIVFYMFLGAFFLMIFALGQLALKDKDLIHYIFSLSFMGQGLVIMQVSLYSTWIYPELYGVIIFLIPVSFAVTPVILMRYVWLFSSTYRLDFKFSLFFIPAILSALYCLISAVPGIVVVSPGDLNAGPLTGESFDLIPLYSKGLYFLIILSKVFFLTLLSFMLVRFFILWRKTHERGRPVQSVFKIGYFFVFIMAVTTVISIAGDIFSMALVRASMVIANTFIFAVYIVSRRMPGYNRNLKIEMHKARYGQSYLGNLDIDSVKEHLYELMLTDKAFADEDLTLKKLSDELGVSSHQLSQILNERLGKNFNTFINEFRIEEAKKLMVEEPDRSIMSISIAVGFNSYTTFCTTFSKIAGMSPRIYRKGEL